MRTRALWLVALLVLAGPAMAERFVSCHDGDTCTLESGQRVRFSGIDAPEIGQPFAIESRDYLNLMVVGRESTLECSGWSYKRQVCDVFVNGMDVQKELVGWGLAYDYEKYSGGKYQKAQMFAQKMRRGVWTLQTGGTRPWEHRQIRRQQKIKQI